MIALAMLLQAVGAPATTTSATSAPPSRSWSILAPVSNEPCARQPGKDADGHDIVVCGNPLPSQKLPYPDEVVPDGPVPSNRYMTGAGALAAEGTPCPISRSCVVGFGPPVVPLLVGAVNAVKGALARKPDKSGRVAIPLDGADAPSGRLEP